MFTTLREATREDWDRIDALDAARTDYAAAPLALLESLQAAAMPAGYTLNPYDHSRPGRDPCAPGRRIGRDDRLHPVPRRGGPAGPANHGQIAAELLQPFVFDRTTTGWSGCTACSRRRTSPTTRTGAAG